MKATPRKSERIYSLDSLRAILMLLGLVFHTTLTYQVKFPEGWDLQDPMGGHIINDFLTSFVHSFRMQHFFLVAGFFGAMLFYERGPMLIIKNRFSRLILPFAVFIMFLYPMVNFGFNYTQLTFSGSGSVLESTLSMFSFPDSFIPKTTKHLWFLYYLILFTGSTVLLGLLFKKLPYLSNRISKIFSWVMQQTKFRILILSGITFLIFSLLEYEQIDGAFWYFTPDVNVFLFYLFFYLIGWILFKSKHLLNTMMKSDLLCVVLGLIVFSIHFFMGETINEITPLKLLIKSITIWLFIFGITGLFIRYSSNYSARMRYISDSSYWVYLLHLPLTMIIPAFIADWTLHPILKVLIVVTSTTAICFLSYHYLVRWTFIGKFLNGKKYSIKSTEIKKDKGPFPLKPAFNK
jgi:glucan biosynthesis protein C